MAASMMAAVPWQRSDAGPTVEVCGLYTILMPCKSPSSEAASTWCSIVLHRITQWPRLTWMGLLCQMRWFYKPYCAL